MQFSLLLTAPLSLDSQYSTAAFTLQASRNNMLDNNQAIGPRAG